MIGENVRVLVLDVREDRVQIGIDAPRDVVILRTEIPREKRLPVDVCQGCYQFHCICLPDDPADDV